LLLLLLLGLSQADGLDGMGLGWRHRAEIVDRGAWRELRIQMRIQEEALYIRYLLILILMLMLKALWRSATKKLKLKKALSCSAVELSWVGSTLLLLLLPPPLPCSADESLPVPPHVPVPCISVVTSERRDSSIRTIPLIFFSQWSICVSVSLSGVRTGPPFRLLNIEH
jgi:hypothetical protein